MSIEKDIFKRLVPDYKKLLNYGFKKNGDKYEYSCKIMKGSFLVEVIVFNDEVCGKIYDLDIDEEYTNFRIETQTGSFVSSIREEFIEVLNSIAQSCFIKKPFISQQANRLYGLIKNKYKDDPIFKFEGYPGFGIYENNSKWYALIMNVDRSKIDSKKGEVELLNVKLNPSEIISLLKKDGYYKAYHMNKKSWISIILDDTVDDTLIMDLIDESRSYTLDNYNKSDDWVMPINPGYFDVFSYFDSTDTYYWDERKSFKTGDIIYMYVTKPVGAIMYKCMVDDISDGFMIIKKICKYEEGKYSLDVLKKYGLTSVRSSRHIPMELKKYIEGGSDER